MTTPRMFRETLAVMLTANGTATLLRVPDAVDVFRYSIVRIRWNRDRATGRLTPNVKHLPVSRAVAARLVHTHHTRTGAR